MYIEDKKATTGDEKAERFIVFSQTVFTKSDCTRSVDERAAIQISEIFLSEIEFKTKMND